MNLMEDQQTPQSAEGEAKVITLCGSTKFEAEFAEVNQRLTMEGCVVISLGMFGLPDLPDYDWTADSSDLKRRLGGVRFQRIRLADEGCSAGPGGSVACGGWGQPRRQGGYATATAASCKRMNIGADEGAMPAKVSLNVRATVTAGLAQLVEEVKK